MNQLNKKTGRGQLKHLQFIEHALNLLKVLNLIFYENLKLVQQQYKITNGIREFEPELFLNLKNVVKALTRWLIFGEV